MGLLHAAAAAAAAAPAPPVDLLEKWLSEVLPGNVAPGSFAAPFLLAALSLFVSLLFAVSDTGKVCIIHQIRRRRGTLIRVEIIAGERE